VYDIVNRRAGRRDEMMFRSRRGRGLTLVEIMIVVAIISLLAAITIPYLLRARHNANEAAAIGALRTISTACESFRAAQSPPDYPANLVELTTETPPYIDESLAAATAAATATKGYFYTYRHAHASHYTCTATPAVSGTTGTRVFFVDKSGVIRINDASGAPIE